MIIQNKGLQHRTSIIEVSHLIDFVLQSKRTTKKISINGIK